MVPATTLSSARATAAARSVASGADVPTTLHPHSVTKDLAAAVKRRLFVKGDERTPRTATAPAPDTCRPLRRSPPGDQQASGPLNIELCSRLAQPRASTATVNTWSHVRHTKWIVSVSEKGLSWTGAVAMSVVAWHWGQRRFGDATRSDAGMTWTEPNRTASGTLSCSKRPRLSPVSKANQL